MMKTLDALETVGGYRMLSILGSGGMGVVFEAQHQETGEVVALKKVRTQDGDDIGCLRREVDALRRLDHPGVVRIVDQGIAGGAPWYAMELLKGEPLGDYNERTWQAHEPRANDSQVTRKAKPARNEVTALAPASETPAHAFAPAPTREVPRPKAACGELPFVLTVARRLCMTLGFMHGEGIVHRDLKASNVLLCEGDVPVLVDFGLAFRFPGAAGREVLADVSSTTVGTVSYMAPEQIRGEMVDARADLYSLGCLLYELITGRLPFIGSNPEEIRWHHLYSTPALPSTLVTGVGKELDDMLMRLLAKRAEDRFGHALEVAQQLSVLGAGDCAWEDSESARSYVYRCGIVGREQALHSLGQRVAQTLNGEGSLLLLSGESGIGKTYLAMAAARAASDRGMTILTGNCTPLGASGAEHDHALLHPFRGFLLRVADRCLASPELTPALFGNRAKLLAACEPSLLALPGVCFEPDPEALPAQAAQQRILSALAETLAAFAARWPSVLVLDDIQWADEPTLNFLASLPDRWFSERKLLLMAVYRADEEPLGIQALEQKPYTHKMAVGRLPEQSVDALVRGMLAISAPPQSLVDLLARQSEGNPFFVAEYLRTAVAEQLLRRSSDGSWQIDARLLAEEVSQSTLPLPTSLASLIARRLSGLSDPARRLLAAAAVLGREVERDLLFSLAGMSDEQAWAPTRELIARQILEDVQSFSSARGDVRLSQLRFLHDKIRETAYNQVPRDQRVSLHRAAASLISRKTRDASAELSLVCATLAHHHRHGQQIEEAIRYFDLAGDHALSTYANHDALGHFETALALDAANGTQQQSKNRYRTAPSEENIALRRARWDRKLAEAHYALGDLAAAERHLHRALRHTGKPVPTSKLGWVTSLLKELPRQILTQSQSRTPPRRAPREHDVLAEAAMALHHLAELHYFSFDALPMLAASLRSVNLAERSGHSVRIAAPYAMLGMTAGIGKLQSLAYRYFELASEAAKATGDDAGLATALYAKATWRIGHGSWDEVREFCRQGREVAERIRDIKSLGMVKTLEGHAAFYTGSFRESTRTYKELEDSARHTGDRQHLSWGLYAGARARICLGDLLEARQMLLESEQILDSLAEVPSQIIASGLLASLYLRMNDLPQAIAAAERTEQRIRGNLPTVFSTVAGYVGVAEVYLTRWELSLRDNPRQSPEAKKAALAAVRALRMFAISIPIGWPAYHRLHGEGLRIARKPQAARRAYRRGIEAARKLRMPYEEALLHAELLRVEEFSAQRLAHLTSAERIFDELECRSELWRVARNRAATS